MSKIVLSKVIQASLAVINIIYTSLITEISKLRRFKVKNCAASIAWQCKLNCLCSEGGSQQSSLVRASRPQFSPNPLNPDGFYRLVPIPDIFS